MNAAIEISFISNGNRVTRRGSFPLKDKKQEQVALNFWKQIQREMPFGSELEKAEADGEDITDLLKDIYK